MVTYNVIVMGGDRPMLHLLISGADDVDSSFLKAWRRLRS